MVILYESDNPPAQVAARPESLILQTAGEGAGSHVPLWVDGGQSLLAGLGCSHYLTVRGESDSAFYPGGVAAAGPWTKVLNTTAFKPDVF